MRQVLLVTAVCLALLAQTGDAYAGPVKVAVTITPLADIVKRVGGDLVEVRTLLKPGQSPHTYEPLPGDVKALSEADMVVKIGFDLELWLDKLLRSSAKKERVEVDCSIVVKKPILSGEEEEHGHEGHMHGAVNPHYWLDPHLMADAALLVGRKLASKAPSQAEVIEKRANAVAAELHELDAEIAAKLSGPQIGKEFVAFHNAWPYFAARYGLRQIGVIETSPGREPSAKLVMQLVKEIKKKKARAVFVEPQFPPQLGYSIAKESGAKVAVVDPEGGVEGRMSYIELMRYNASQFENALMQR